MNTVHGRALHVEADDVNITNSEFTRNYGGTVYIESNTIVVARKRGDQVLHVDVDC